MRRISAPVTVALGQHDEGISLEHGLAISRLVRDGNFVVLPNVSHFALLQRPAEFSAHALSFLRWR